MLAYVYKSVRKDETYLYLPQRDGFDVLPDALRAQLGGLVFVMDVDLSPPRRLARVEVASVVAGLRDEGYFLQLPPRHPDLLDGAV